MSKKVLFSLFVILVLATVGCTSSRGVTNLDSLTLDSDLIVGDDATITDDLAVGGDLTLTGGMDVDGGMRVDPTLGVGVDDNAYTSIGATLNSSLATANVYGLNVDVDYTPATTSTYNAIGALFSVTSNTDDVIDDVLGVSVAASSAQTQTLDDMIGYNSYVYLADGAASTVDDLYGFYVSAIDLEDGTATDSYGVHTSLADVDTGTLDDDFGLYIGDAVVGTGAITNSVGIYIENIDSGSVDNYSIYSVGGEGYHAGDWNLGGSGELVGALVDVNATITDTVLGRAQSGALVSMGTTTHTLTLPSAIIGLEYCFYNDFGNIVYVDPAAGDQVLVLTDATGDRISNDTAGSSVCLVALDDDYWLALGIVGTWADAN